MSGRDPVPVRSGGAAANRDPAGVGPGASASHRPGDRDGSEVGVGLPGALPGSTGSGVRRRPAPWSRHPPAGRNHRGFWTSSTGGADTRTPATIKTVESRQGDVGALPEQRLLQTASARAARSSSWRRRPEHQRSAAGLAADRAQGAVVVARAPVGAPMTLRLVPFLLSDVPAGVAVPGDRASAVGDRPIRPSLVKVLPDAVSTPRGSEAVTWGYEETVLVVCRGDIRSLSLRCPVDEQS